MLNQRGFENAILRFIECVQGDIKPITNGLEGLKTPQLLHSLLHAANKK